MAAARSSQLGTMPRQPSQDAAATHSTSVPNGSGSNAASPASPLTTTGIGSSQAGLSISLSPSRKSLAAAENATIRSHSPAPATIEHRTGSPRMDRTTRHGRPHGGSHGGPHGGPPSRSNTPFESGKVMNLPGLNTPDEAATSSRGSPMSGGQQDDDEGDDGENRGAGSSSTSHLEYIKLLPQKASSEEAQRAIAKLNKMQASKKSQKRWLKATGMTVVHRKRRGSQEGQDGREGHDAESETPGTLSPFGTPSEPQSQYRGGEENGDEDGDSRNRHVQLGITSLPDYSVLAVKRTASRTRRVVNNANPKQRAFFGHKSQRVPQIDFGKEQGDDEEDDDDGDVDDHDPSPVKAMAGSEAAQVASPTPSKTRKDSIGHRLRHFGSFRQQPSPSLDAQAVSAMTQSKSNPSSGWTTEPQTVAPQARRRSLNAPQAASASLAARLTPDPTASSPDFKAEELGAVPEEDHGGTEGGTTQSPDETVIDRVTHGRPERPQIRIPTLHLQEASLQSIDVPNAATASRDTSSSSSSVAVRPVATRGALSFDNNGSNQAKVSADQRNRVSPKRILRDSPDQTEDFVSSPIDAPDDAFAMLRREVSSSSSGAGDDIADTTTTASFDDERDGGADFTDEENPQLAMLALDHGSALTNKEMRRQLKRDKAIPRNSINRTSIIGHKVSRGLHYASSQSRNRRAMEKFSPNPQRPLSPDQQSQQGGAGSFSLGRRSSTPTALGDLSLSRFNSSATSSSQQTGSNLKTALQSGWNPAFSMSPSASATNAGPPDAHKEGETDPLTRPGTPDTIRLPSSAAQSVNASRENLDDPDPDVSSNNRFWPRRRSQHQQALASSLRAASVTPGEDDSSMVGMSGAPVTSHLAAPRPWHFRERRKWAKSHAEEALPNADEAIGSTLAEQDPEQELDEVLGRMAAQEAPEQAGEKMEWDVLYENQRGMLFFGIPKFSSRTLMQWDPSPWTDRWSQNSPYNVFNAQLPDPSWRWVYPEWFIDMAGDVDEQGWQYSGNFGSNPLARMSKAVKVMPRRTKGGDIEMVEWTKHRGEKRQAKEQGREDDGLEALKRSIKARGSKWTGRPDPGSFVRRRRWIRLRSREALAPQNEGASGKKTSQAVVDTKQSQIHLVKDRGIAKGDKSDSGLDTVSVSSDSRSDSLSTTSSSEGSEMDEEDETSSNEGRPRRPLQPSHPKQSASSVNPSAQRRRQREVESAMIELHSVLTSLVEPDRRVTPHPLNNELAACLETIDARNPFLSWQRIKGRLNEGDMSWKTTTLRQMERRFQQHGHVRRATWSQSGLHSSPRISGDGFRQNSESGFGRVDARSSPDAVSSFDSWELTRSAIVEMNYSRVKRVLRACNIDRHRLELWSIWLDVSGERRQQDKEMASHRLSPNGDVNELGRYHSDRRARQSSARFAGHQQMDSMNSGPEANDVWDVLERRLDPLLQLFEFSASRATLLRLLLALHDSSHTQHHYRDTHWKMEDYQGHQVRVHAPNELDPRRRPTQHMRQLDWIVGLSNRLQFFSESHSIAEALEQGSNADLAHEMPNEIQQRIRRAESTPLQPNGNVNAGDAKSAHRREPSAGSGGTSSAYRGALAGSSSPKPHRTGSPALDHWNDLGLGAASNYRAERDEQGHTSLYWREQRPSPAPQELSASAHSLPRSSTPTKEARKRPLPESPPTSRLTNGFARPRSPLAASAMNAWDNDRSALSSPDMTSESGQQTPLARPEGSLEDEAEDEPGSTIRAPGGRDNGSATLKKPARMAALSAVSQRLQHSSQVEINADTPPPWASRPMGTAAPDLQQRLGSPLLAPGSGPRGLDRELQANPTQEQQKQKLMALLNQDQDDDDGNGSVDEDDNDNNTDHA